ncbi:MAG: hypothetical protein JSU86_09255 [Phycisphaerales bacterium]|nr:MAG: hypothetical protein JSU86_09255 [Phycisphaerales bacterium]
MKDSLERLLIPELARVEPGAARRRLRRRAFFCALDNWGWLIYLLIFVIIYVVFEVVATECCSWLGVAYRRWVRAATRGLANGVGFLLALWVLRIRMRGSVRRQLIQRGLPTCLACGYNLTGNVSGVCPECGREIEQP